MTRRRGGRWLAGAAVLASVGVLQVSLASPVSAQGPVYTATPPTPGALYRDGQSGRYLLGGTWLYRADLSNVGLTQGWWKNVAATSGWTPVTVPNAYNAGDFSTLSNSGYVGWYRRDFTLPAHAFAKYVPASARQWIIRFESVNYRATVWLNGRLVGSHTGAYLPFEFDLHPHPGVNRLIVRVDDTRGPGDLPPVGNTWWNYGGLLREVYLRTAQRADIQLAQVRPILPCPTCSARIEEQATIRNVTDSPQRVTLRGRFGKLPLSFGSATIRARGTWTPSASTVVEHPNLWAPGHPALYEATLTLSDSRGRTLGGYTTYSGIRSIKVNANGHLTINGRLLNLRGAFIHEQNYLTGAALSPAQLAALMGWERELGADVIRSHYPLNPEILEMADRYGILVWDEIPAWQVSDQYLGSPSWLAFAHSFLRQNILDNQNHPSVMLWSIGNELPTPATANEARYIAGAAALARRLDPTRPVGMATSGWPGVPCQSAYAPLDVIGNNEYFGWFDAGGGSTDDRDALSPYLDSLRACYPKKALFVTEFGFDANRDGPVEERGTYEFQSNSAAFHLGVFASKPWLSGAIYFALQDFASKPGWGGGNPLPNPPWIYKGLVDQYGALKPAFSVVSSIYHATVQVGPAPHGR
ncbi:MAG TPA: glycoside hydrolase family 2 TIM barrel-domain containing protein [Solirubrobacteraceae bacterium]|nr:glycoside hydrolase family 2 TIM barrel-domain containing protein [Solirubrobacteraceae bacterium]